MKSIPLSLEKLLGTDYMQAVCDAAVYLYGMSREQACTLASQDVELMPEGFLYKVDGMLEQVGRQVVAPMKNPVQGAPTDSFGKASDLKASPTGGLGYLRLGEDGRLYLMSKSEHYHAPLGHAFPGYQLIDYARALGISNTTHNNTRGSITRRLELELVRTANGLSPDDTEGLKVVLASEAPQVLNRVINLETGSLAVEAGVKMMLARFYRLEKSFSTPKYEGRTPVFFVIGDREGGCKANYHGTTVLTQTMRDLWPGLYEKMEAAGIIKVCPIEINNIEDFKAKLKKYDTAPYKVAGFLHEIILMNYGGIRLDEAFLHEVYSLCHNSDVPVLCDEIQSCMWYPGMFLFREYALNPDFVVIGKGFPGGQFAASRILTTKPMDSLNQFGALVTNGQEDLAALAYLITMAFSQANREYIKEIGDYYESRLREMVKAFPDKIECVEGKAHLSTLFFREVEQAVRFTQILNAGCIDISAHTYKAMCPPSALTKLPLIATRAMVDFLVGKMMDALKKV